MQLRTVTALILGLLALAGAAWTDHTPVPGPVVLTVRSRDRAMASLFRASPSTWRRELLRTSGIYLHGNVKALG